MERYLFPGFLADPAGGYFGLRAINGEVGGTATFLGAGEGGGHTRR